MTASNAKLSASRSLRKCQHCIGARHCASIRGGGFTLSRNLVTFVTLFHSKFFDFVHQQQKLGINNVMKNYLPAIIKFQGSPPISREQIQSRMWLHLWLRIQKSWKYFICQLDFGYFHHDIAFLHRSGIQEGEKACSSSLYSLAFNPDSSYSLSLHLFTGLQVAWLSSQIDTWYRKLKQWSRSFVRSSPWSYRWWLSFQKTWFWDLFIPRAVQNFNIRHWFSGT